MGCKLVDIASLLQRYFAPSLWLAIGCNSIVSIFRERQNCLSLGRRELPSPFLLTLLVLLVVVLLVATKTIGPVRRCRSTLSREGLFFKLFSFHRFTSPLDSSPRSFLPHNRHVSPTVWASPEAICQRSLSASGACSYLRRFSPRDRRCSSTLCKIEQYKTPKV